MIASALQLEMLFQSTLPVRGATGPERLGVCAGHISIHAPREGSDESVSATLLMEE